MSHPADRPRTADVTRLEAALAYADVYGWSVFPCRGKVPLIEGGHGLHDATTDSAQIERWWFAYPYANIGIACGASGLAVLDADPRAGGGMDVVMELRLPRTPQVLTGGGGWHYYFSQPDGWAVTARRDGLPPGIDVKGAGGYVIAPPSVTGNAYRWLHPPKERPLAPWPFPEPPERLFGPRAERRECETPDPVALRILGEECARVSGQPAGQGRRRMVTFERACAVGNLVGSGELPFTNAEEQLLAAALRNGLEHDRAIVAVREGLRVGMQTPRRIRTGTGA